MAKIDDETAARMLLGSPLTYALMDGILASDNVPRFHAPKRIRAIADLFVRAIGELNRQEVGARRDRVVFKQFV